MNDAPRGATVGASPVSPRAEFAPSRLGSILLAAFLAAAARGATDGNGAPADEESYLRHMLNLQRFQALCRSTGDDPPIRVLIYGQSITAQSWSTQVVDAVRARHPGRQWVVENRSIGGHPAQYLEHTAEADLFPFNPDLLVFHAYGDLDAYRRLVAAIRARTTSDILLVNDHYAFWDHLDAPGIGDWNGKQLPALALDNGACVADVRTPWKQYLLLRGLPLDVLLYDGVHPNPDGQALLREWVLRYADGPAVVPTPDPFAGDRSRRVAIPADAAASGTWTLPFVGNRVCAHVGKGTASVSIDGKPPGAWPSGGVHGRASTWPGGWWPCLLQIRATTPLVPEQWRLRIDSMKGAGSFRFTVTGSVTGVDGSGSTDSAFRSTSGRVAIQPGDWYWDAPHSALLAGMEFTWTSNATGADGVAGNPGAPATWVDVVSNLDPGTHELVLRQSPGAPAIREVVVYNPDGDILGARGVACRLRGAAGFGLLAPGNLQVSDDFGTWKPATPGGAKRSAHAQSNQGYFPYADSGARFFRIQP